MGAPAEAPVLAGATGAALASVGLTGAAVSSVNKFGFFGRVGRESVANVATKAVNYRVEKMTQVIEEFLGSDYKFIKNKKGDPLFINRDNTKRIRFDSAYSHGDDPHGHIEIFKDNDWIDFTDQHRIYLSPKPEFKPDFPPKNKF